MLQASEPTRKEFWRGVYLDVPKSAAITRHSRFDVWGIYVDNPPEFYSVDLEKWRMPRNMWRMTTKQVVATFRRDGQNPAKRFSMRARGGKTIIAKFLTPNGWVYQKMVRLDRKTFVEATTSFNKWRSIEAQAARKLVDSLTVR